MEKYTAQRKCTSPANPKPKSLDMPVSERGGWLTALHTANKRHHCQTGMYEGR